MLAIALVEDDVEHIISRGLGEGAIVELLAFHHFGVGVGDCHTGPCVGEGYSAIPCVEVEIAPQVGCHHWVFQIDGGGGGLHFVEDVFTTHHIAHLAFVQNAGRECGVVGECELLAACCLWA